MDQIRIIGGTSLTGTVDVGGAKNAALPILAASLLGSGDCEIEYLPQVRDVSTMIKLLQLLGVTAQGQGGTITLNAKNVQSVEAPYELVKTMRASILSLGPLLARLGEAKVSLPGVRDWDQTRQPSFKRAGDDGRRHSCGARIY